MHCFVFTYMLGYILKRFVDLENTLNLCQIVLKISEYLAYELSHRPDSWQGFLYIYLVSLPRLRTSSFDWFASSFLMAWQRKQRIQHNTVCSHLHLLLFFSKNKNPTIVIIV